MKKMSLKTLRIYYGLVGQYFKLNKADICPPQGSMKCPFWGSKIHEFRLELCPYISGVWQVFPNFLKHNWCDPLIGVFHRVELFWHNQLLGVRKFPFSKGTACCPESISFSLAIHAGFRQVGLEWVFAVVLRSSVWAFVFLLMFPCFCVWSEVEVTETKVFCSTHFLSSNTAVFPRFNSPLVSVSESIMRNIWRL